MVVITRPFALTYSAKELQLRVLGFGLFQNGDVKDLYDSISTGVFQDYSDMDNVRVRLLAAN
jgi:hypothetical protein